MATQTMFLPNTPLLLSVARNSVERSESNSQEALVAIVFSCLALESFVNESYEPIRYLFRPDNSKFLVDYAVMMEGMVKDRKDLKCKYYNALSYFKGADLTKGQQPYQDFKKLVDIRNSLAHNKPDVFVHEFYDVPRCKVINDHPKFIHHLKTNKIIKVDDFHCNWIDLLLDKKVAEWALRTAERMIQEFISIVPDGQFKKDLGLLHAAIDSGITDAN